MLRRLFFFCTRNDGDLKGRWLAQLFADTDGPPNDPVQCFDFCSLIALQEIIGVRIVRQISVEGPVSVRSLFALRPMIGRRPVIGGAARPWVRAMRRGGSGNMQ